MEFRPEYGRPPPEFYRGVDYPDYRDREFRESEYRDWPRHDFTTQRARSHSRLDPEYIPSDFPTYGRPLDKSLRSKSLDHRDAFRDDPSLFDDRRGVNIPIYRERNERNYDYERDLYTPFVRKEDRRDGALEATRSAAYSREVDIPMKRMPRALTRSTEWLARRNYDDRPRNPRDLSRTEGYSPKSASSSKRHNLNISVDPGRGRREYGRSEEFIGYGRDDGREMYRDEARHMEGDVRGGGSSHKRQAHSSYHYESHGGGGAGFGSPVRRPITQQPMHGPAPPPAPGGAYRPIRHHRVKCCCFNFTWPPWSYEPTAPPQPLYRNI
ncbi:hypothetical protein ANCCAN_19972 [Ancylostoma caninum]|uniref:Uncharacterized protein n=1 Tax=Ancylostoma caninum TaxID=29170 RepID=A0A368FT42_ANCCA|nr:hypothetical protein ANCCAN_19972 [Ancylostoma caninum]